MQEIPIIPIYHNFLSLTRSHEVFIKWLELSIHNVMTYWLHIHPQISFVHMKGEGEHLGDNHPILTGPHSNHILGNMVVQGRHELLPFPPRSIWHWIHQTIGVACGCTNICSKLLLCCIIPLYVGLPWAVGCRRRPARRRLWCSYAVWNSRVALSMNLVAKSPSRFPV